MTEWESLIACRNQWQLLLITGSSIKNIYIPSINWKHECACCEYVSKNYVSAIDDEAACQVFCPLRGYAWDGHCTNNPSFFYKWIDCRVCYNKKYALKMVNACNRAIEAMIGRGEVQ